MKNIFLKYIFQYTYILFLVLCHPTILQASGLSDNPVKYQRLRKIGLMHVKLELSAGGMTNYFLRPMAYFGVGSKYTLFSADLGIGYKTTNPIIGKCDEGVGVSHFPVCVSANIHPYRFRSGYLYIGIEAAFNTPIGGKHVVFNKRVRDLRLGTNYLSGRGHIGVKYNKVGAFVFAEYDFMPSFNQKYIFESTEYEYNNLKRRIFERYRFGVGFTYYFDF